jgi:hypothetical protein
VFIELFETTSIDRLGRTWRQKRGRFICDQCEILYISNQLKRDLSRQRNYCSKRCSDESKKPGGLSHAQFRKTNNDRYGVNAPAQNKTIYDKVKATNTERYGAPCVFSSSQIQQQAIETRIQRYGVEYSAQIPGVMGKVAKTNLERYGAINPMNGPDIVAKYDKDCIYEKKLSTMKRNGTVGKRISNPERKFHQLLTTQFTNDDIITQKKVPEHQWCIDFYIRSINTWIQVDGVYWHGLDRPIETIRESNGKQAQAIYHKWCGDQRQNIWFAEHNMKLLRFTDKEVLAMTELPSSLF